MPAEGTPLVQFRAGELAGALHARTDDGMSVGLVAQRDLARYYECLRRSLPTFSVAEASLLMDALNGTLTEPHTVSLLWASVADSLEDGLAEKWGVDGPALVARVRGMSYAQVLATADAVERAWQSGQPADTALGAVGLVQSLID